MCGIAGVFNLDGKPFPEERLKRMAGEIAHRGPDGEGYFIKEGIALAHRRLAILDVTDKARQPMSSKDGKWTVVFNGCIYNFREIRETLIKRGHRFDSASDTEVIAEGLSEWGSGVFELFNGMFAVAAWNSEEKSLWLSRDRFGVKPLYYWFNGKTFVFSSEIKAILLHPAYTMSVDINALNEYFTFQNLFSYRTLFKGIFMLPQANTIKIDSNTRSIIHNSWWDYDFSSPDEKMSFGEAREETLRLLKQAVVRQMVSDVPVGSYLSGGMDSGSITAIASQNVPRLTTFTCGFDMSGVSGVEANFDERRDAELMANAFKTEHYEQVINAGDLRWSLPSLVWHLEDLRTGMSYPNFYIARLASKFVKVCLQGTGGDELFGGYPWRYYRVFGSVSKKEFFEQYYGFWQRLVSDSQKKELFTEDVFRQTDIDEPRMIFERVFTFNTRLKYDTPEQHIQNSLYFEIKTFLNGLLIVGDKLSMANGLEERFPFLDNDLVNFAQKIPVRHKLGNLEEELKRIDENLGNKKMVFREFNDGKNVLRKAMQELIPEKIIKRQKQGFSSPDESWYRGENALFVKETLVENNCISFNFLNRKFVEKTVDEHINRGINHRLLIWSMLCFEKWCEKFLT